MACPITGECLHVTPDPSLLRDFVDAGCHLFPLTAHNDVSVELQSRGKRPWRKGWNGAEARSLTFAEAAAHMKAGRNIGNRLNATDLVIDIDPRHLDDGVDYSDPDIAYRGAVAALEAWTAAHGFDRSGWPIYRTGSGGLHVRLRKPADVKVVTRLVDRPGFEFKSAGGAVVASGSVHARTGRRYEPDPSNRVALKNAPLAPPTLLQLLHRPEYQNVAGGGELSPAEIEELLAVLDPQDYRDQGDWFRLMCACHSASAGAAEEEFLAWSAGDPKYADHGEANRARWRSLVSGRPGGATFRTLFKAVSDVGRADLVASFPDDDVLEEGFDVEGEDGLELIEEEELENGR